MDQCVGAIKIARAGRRRALHRVDDDDIETAVEGGIAQNSGIPVRPASAPTAIWRRTVAALKVADGFEPGAVIGPLIDAKAVEKVEARLADAVKKRVQGDQWQPPRWGALMRAVG
jgi:hypothetical protein